MNDPSGQKRRAGGSRPGDSWERRAADLANDVQRWLIKSSARNMRDELGDQVKKAFRGQGGEPADVWATATTEPPDAADQPPECAWCPICRAARRMALAQGSGDAAASAGAAVPKGATPGLAGAADVLFGAARDALVGLDTILSYRPGEASSAGSGGSSSQASTAGDSGGSSPQVGTADSNGTRRGAEEEHEPDHRS